MTKDTTKIKPKRMTKDTHTIISVTNAVGKVLTNLKGNFSYGDYIKYLLIKTGYIKVSDDDLKEYLAMENYFEYINKQNE